MKRYELMNFKDRTGETYQSAKFYLKDYLIPNGKYPYRDLASDLEQALAEVGDVYLVSVPGFLMLSGTNKYPDLDPWSKNHFIGEEGEFFKTAAEALKYEF